MNYSDQFLAKHVYGYQSDIFHKYVLQGYLDFYEKQGSILDQGETITT